MEGPFVGQVGPDILGQIGREEPRGLGFALAEHPPERTALCAWFDPQEGLRLTIELPGAA
jgi:hypothetical protein